VKLTVTGTVGTESEHRVGSCWEGVKLTVTGTVGTKSEQRVGSCWEGMKVTIKRYSWY